MDNMDGELPVIVHLALLFCVRSTAMQRDEAHGEWLPGDTGMMPPNQQRVMEPVQRIL